MKTGLIAFSIAAILGGSVAARQMTQGAPAAGSITAGSKLYYGLVKDWITKGAAQMPEANYSFQPTKDVRTFGQLIGHLADANFMFCGNAGGTKGPAQSIEKTKTTKADLQQALADSFASCDKAWAAMTDKTAMTPAGAWPPGIPLPAMDYFSVLQFNTSHEAEHYGNIVTYYRLKGMVPPSSQGPGGG
jgi:uncharacterized damage-inducible protein DinB